MAWERIRPCGAGQVEGLGVDVTRALVTGASSGIGAATARDLAGRGVDLVVVSRSGERLAALAVGLAEEHGVTVEVLPADLTTGVGRDAVETRLAADPPIDLLVNNAGVAIDREVADTPVEQRIGEVELNVVAVTRLAVVAAALFRGRGHGAILNVSSVTAFLPFPGTATYAAGKAYVLSLSEAMHVELAPHGVHVTALCPGFTRTELFDAGGVDVSSVPSLVWLDAEQVARAGIDGVLANRAVVTPGRLWQAMRFSSRLTVPPVARRLPALFERFRD